VPHRLFVSITVSAALFIGSALCAAAAPAAAAAPPRVARGHTLHIKLTTRTQADCVAVVEWADGLNRVGSVKKAQDGLLSWAIPVPRTATLGPGRWWVQCGLGVERRGTFIVVRR
jgi:hypothetical protein